MLAAAKNPAALLVTAALILGGGTRPGFLGDVILQVLAALFIAMLIADLVSKRPARPVPRSVIAGLTAVAALPAIQLIPLPPSLWAAMPGRAHAVDGLALAEVAALPWRPLSLTPVETWTALMSILPVMAIAIAVARSGYAERRRLGTLILAFGGISVLLGLLQVAQGQSSSLRPFEFTNLTEAVGFFANRNHFAALLYCTLLLAVASVMAALAEPARSSQARLDSTRLLVVAGLFCLIILAFAGQLMARSRAGLGLTMAALVGAAALTWSRSGTDSRASRNIVVAAVAVSLLLATQFALLRVLERFEQDALADARVGISRNLAGSIVDFLPFGTGMGSFVPVYAFLEKPADTFSAFANRAHNDLLEFVLEAGIPGALLLGAFLVWFAARSFAIWRRDMPGSMPSDVALARASTLIVLLLLAHSIVDYPLRTATMSAIFVVACVLMIPPSLAPHEVQPGVAAARSRPVRSLATPRPAERHPVSWPPPPQGPGQTTPRPAVTEPRAPSSAQPPLPPESETSVRQRWGDQVDWPDGWRDGAPPGPPARKRDRPPPGEES